LYIQHACNAHAMMASHSIKTARRCRGANHELTLKDQENLLPAADSARDLWTWCCPSRRDARRRAPYCGERQPSRKSQARPIVVPATTIAARRSASIARPRLSLHRYLAKSAGFALPTYPRRRARLICCLNAHRLSTHLRRRSCPVSCRHSARCCGRCRCADQDSSSMLRLVSLRRSRRTAPPRALVIW